MVFDKNLDWEDNDFYCQSSRVYTSLHIVTFSYIGLVIQNLDPDQL